MRSLSVRANHVRMGTLGLLSLFVLIFAIGCGGGGGGSSSQKAAAAIATAPIDLPAGQTTANLVWDPSEGEVTGYLVFRSNGEEGFRFLRHVTAPEIQITGAPGDSLRILVVARGAASSESEASPPSPPIRFHAAAEAVSAVDAAAPTVATASSSSTQAQTADPESSPAEEQDSGADAEELADASDSVEADGNDVDDADDANGAVLDLAMRDRLLRSEARFPMRTLSTDASGWIQSFVDAEVGAGVSLAGSGDLDGDALGELVWVDSAGQLFVSEGAHVATAEDLPNTFIEAIRLRSTERFLGLADFDGDGRGDWIVEDTTTGDLWVLDDETQEARFSHVAASNPDRGLVGHGDFDGDGRTELLWQNADQSFQINRENGDLDPIEWIHPEEDVAGDIHATSELLTVADLDGDGRDDLVFRGTDGLLELALALPDSSGLQFEWVQGPAASSEGLELVATLDLDRDGTAEIAWWRDGELEIWDLPNDL